MIKNYNKKTYKWSFVGLMIIVILSSYSLTNAIYLAIHADQDMQNESKPSDTGSPSAEEEQTDPDIHLVTGTQDEKPGNLTKEEVTIGNIHLGDTKQTVFQTLGEPSEKRTDQKTGEDIWYYSKHDATIIFYKSSPSYPAGGVIRIQINESSDLSWHSPPESVLSGWPSANLHLLLF
jgi:outer membrane protein assembly factor BamE (lipoprotein component of BamABCDE complex)